MPVATGLLLNDSDPNRDVIKVVTSTVTAAAHGTVTIGAAGDGTFTYVPNANYNGTDTFTYQVTDGRLVSNFATVTITITPVNDPPVAVNDAYSTPQDVNLIVNAASGIILSNDSDVDNATTTLRATLVASVSHGTLTLLADGSFGYNPTTGYAGTDSFTYFVTDPGGLTSNVATVTITILPQNIDVVATPVCVNDSAYVNYSVSAVNFTPPPGATVLVEWFDSLGTIVRTDTAQPQSGQLLWPGMVLSAGQPVDWPGWVLSGGLWLVGNDGFQLTKPVATVRFTMTKAKSTSVSYPLAVTGCNPNPRPNQAPTAVNDAYTTAEDTALTVPASGILTNDTDPENGPLTVALPIITQPAHGTVTQNADGSLTYMPALNYNGTDSYTYKAKDAAGNLSNTATVTITITPVNDPPVAVNDAATTPMNTAITLAVVNNDTDPDGDALTVISFTAPTTGTVTQSGNQLVYTPATGFFGTATFTYTISDGHGGTSTATVTITIPNGNHPPVAVNDAATTMVGMPVAIAVLGNDSDPDGDVISVVSNTSPAHGAVTRVGGVFTYTPAAGFTGIDTFTYTISDGHGGVATATVTITVSGCVAGVSTTYTQGGWGANPNGNNPGALLAARFATVYPLGVQVGGARALKFTTAAAIAAFLPQGGTAGVLSESATNPTSSTAGVLAGQVLALQLNVDFSTVGITKFGLGNKVVGSGKLAGYTVTQVLALANAVMGGGALPTGVTITDINAVADSINQNYDNGTVDYGYLRPDPACGVPNRAPVAVNDAYTTAKNAVLSIPSPGVKANDSDPDGDAIVAELVSTVTHGTLALAADGSFIYTPTTNYVGVDTFTYKVKDTKGVYSNVATVTITITAAVCNLEAKNDAYTTNKNHAIMIAARGVMMNDQDPYGRGLTVSEVNGRAAGVSATVATAHGTVKLNADGSFVYTPAANYAGADSFTYKVKSAYNNAISNLATVSIAINAHYDGDGCDHDRHRGTHRDGDACSHDREAARHYAGDTCDHDRSRNGHHVGDGCAHDRDVHRHYANDGCDHERGSNGHRAGDGCSHDTNVKAHYDGDGCDHDRRRSGHKDGDNCTHDRDTRHHNDGDNCDHDGRRNGHTDGDKCEHDRDTHGHNAGDGCDHDGGRNGHYAGDKCEHDDHASRDDSDNNPCIATTGEGTEHHPGTGHDDQHHSGDFCDHDRNRKGHFKGDGCEHDRVASHSVGDGCDHDRRRNGHYAGDRCDHDRANKGDRDWTWGWKDRS